MANFYWAKDEKEAEKEQSILVNLVKTESSDFNSADFRTGLAVGTAYEENTKTAFAVCAIFDKNGRITDKITSAFVEVDFPYVPGLLAFRVGPAICTVIDKFVNEIDLLLFDGQGIAHPAGFGLASHIGVLFNKPSIGITKKSLFGNYSSPSKGICHTDLRHPRTNKTIGYCMSFGYNYEPFFMSPGHQITLWESLNVLRMITKKNDRLPYSIRFVHGQANRLAKEHWRKLMPCL